MKSGSSISKNRRSKKASTVAFPIAPRPFEDESPISWVQRICGEHHCTYATLEKLLEFKPKLYDWDDSVDRKIWSCLTRICGYKADACYLGFRRNQIAAKFLGKDKWQMFTRKSPSYKWCTLCWRDDPIPYLRWIWRWEKVNTCTVHRVKLQQFCPWCNSPMLLKRALLTKSGPYVGVPDLSYCGSCAMPMADATVDVGVVGPRTERDFCWESWNYLQEQVTQIGLEISKIEAERRKNPAEKNVLNEEQKMLIKKYAKTTLAARTFMGRFLSDGEVSL